MEDIYREIKIKHLYYGGINLKTTFHLEEIILNKGFLNLKIIGKDSTMIHALYIMFFHTVSKGNRKFTAVDEDNIRYALFYRGGCNLSQDTLFCSMKYIAENSFMSKDDCELETKKLHCDLLIDTYAVNIKKPIIINYDRDIRFELKTEEKNDEFTIICLTIESSKKQKLDYYVFDILDVFFFYLGLMPKILKWIYIFGKMEVNLYFRVPPEYTPNSGYTRGAILKQINNNSMSAVNIKNFVDYKEEQPLLYNSFLLLSNTPHYRDVVTAQLIEILEGIYNSDFRLTHGKNDTDWPHLGDKINYYLNPNYQPLAPNEKTSLVFKKTKNIDGIIDKLKEIRNNHSHMYTKTNSKTSVYEDARNLNAKLVLVVRIAILEKFGLLEKTDERKIRKIVIDMDFTEEKLLKKPNKKSK